MKAFTIINNNKLVGVIKLSKEMLEQLAPDKVILLESKFIKGDTTILSFDMRVLKEEKVKILKMEEEKCNQTEIKEGRRKDDNKSF